MGRRMGRGVHRVMFTTVAQSGVLMGEGLCVGSDLLFDAEAWRKEGRWLVCWCLVLTTRWLRG